VHRIGRTARAGKSGAAISFACEDYAMNLIDIEAYTKTTIPTISISNELLSKPNPPVKMKEGRIKPSGKPGGRRPPRSGNGPGNSRGSSRRRRQHT
jgi:ATP-dependent RNA helicase RhlB